MKKINFTCSHCGGHNLMAEKPLQWIQLNVVGLNDDGDLLFDHPNIVDDDNDRYDFEIYCKDCYEQFSLASIKKMINKE